MPPVSPAPANDLDTVRKLREAHARLKTELAKVIVGQDEVIDQLLLAIFCRSHALLMGVPGLAKTLMVNTLAQALDLSFKRIQFTPDLMPSDITGSEVIQDDPATRQRMFKFLPGPLFANIVLADEINRTPPKTQAALLEAMQERQRAHRRRYATYPTADAVLRARHAEPHRAGRHLPAARGAARPLPVPDQRRLPDAGGRGAERS